MCQALLWVGKAKPSSSRNLHGRQSQLAIRAVNCMNKCPFAWDSPSWRLLHRHNCWWQSSTGEWRGVLFQAVWSGDFSQRRRFGGRSLSVRSEPYDFRGKITQAEGRVCRRSWVGWVWVGWREEGEMKYMGRGKTESCTNLAPTCLPSFWKCWNKFNVGSTFFFFFSWRWC